MTSSMGFLADAVLVVHALFVAWVVLGALAVWRWPRLAWLHLPAAPVCSWLFGLIIRHGPHWRSRLIRLVGGCPYLFSAYGGVAMERNHRTICAVAVAVSAALVSTAPVALADDGWVAVANSPNHEQQDWGYGPDRASAELNALLQCAAMERATDCRVLASSTDCVATAWDVSEPLNRIYAGSGGGPEAAAAGAIAAAGPYANDLQVRCTWWLRTDSAPQQAPGTTLTAARSPR